MLPAAALWLVVAGPCLAQPGPQPRVVKMTLEPALPTAPAMRYSLLPEVRDLRTGNAAIFYHRSRSPEWEHALARDPDFGHFSEWLELPLAKAPLEKVEHGAISQMLREVDIAARMEHCDWQMLPRVRDEGYLFLLPDLHAARTTSVLLALRSRAEMRAGKLERAAYTFQTGLAMSKHVAEAPTLVNYLVGVACATNMLQRVEEFVQQPGAPNLYWPLTDLPRPLIDLRVPLQGERVFSDQLFPGLRQALADPQAPPIPAHQLRASLERLRALGLRSTPLESVVSAVTTYPRARQFLLDRGRTPEAVAALPVAQVGLMYGLARYEVWADEVYKLNKLPYWEARTRLKEIGERRRAEDRDREADLGQFGALFQNPARIYLAQARLQRHLELLRCVEAVRLHAARHGGTLPAALADIREVPVPEDPMTGKTFRYTREGGRAVLETPPLPDERRGEQQAVRIEITLTPRP
jgi:hypothetical protein